jgi:hypothetical protein
VPTVVADARHVSGGVKRDRDPSRPLVSSMALAQERNFDR